MIIMIISFLNSNQAIFSSKSSLPTFRPQCCGLLQGTSSTDWEYTINTEKVLDQAQNNTTLLIKEALYIRLSDTQLINRDEGVTISDCWRQAVSHAAAMTSSTHATDH